MSRKKTNSEMIIDFCSSKNEMKLYTWAATSVAKFGPHRKFGQAALPQFAPMP